MLDYVEDLFEAGAVVETETLVGADEHQFDFVRTRLPALSVQDPEWIVRAAFFYV